LASESQAGVERRQHGIAEQRGLVQPGYRAALEQERGPEKFVADEALSQRGQRGPVGGRQWLRVTPGTPAPRPQILAWSSCSS
jgi:hypothetical protein